MSLISRLPSFRLSGVLPLVLWTLFIWGTRLRNAFDDDALAGAERVQAFGTAGVFVVGALGVAAMMWLRRGEPLASLDKKVIGAAAFGTSLFWVIRMVTISFGDHDLAFIVVHAVLGCGSIALSVLAARAVGHLLAGSPRPRYERQ